MKIHLSTLSQYCFVSVLTAMVLGHSTWAQSDTSHYQSEMIIGRNLETHKNIVAKTIEFSNKLARYEINAQRGSASIFLRENGYSEDFYEDIIRYDLHADSILWFKKYDYRHTLYLEHDSILLKSIANKTTRIDLQTGKVIWHRKGANFGVDSRFNLGYMYNFKKNNYVSNNLVGIDLSTGEPLWERSFSHYYGWNNIEVFNDTTALITSDGLHTINLKTGRGWDFDAATGEIDESNIGGVALGMGLAVTFGVIGGTIVYASINPNGYTVDVIDGPNYYRDYSKLHLDLCSNVLKVGNHLYFTSKFDISKINFKTGEVIWQNYVPGWKAAKAEILIKDGNLLNINLGYSLLVNKKEYLHKPSISMIDTSNGGIIYSTILKRKKQFIIDYQIIGSEIILLYSSHIIKLNLTNGEILKELDLEEPFLHYNNDFEADVAFAENHYIQEDEGKFHKTADVIDQEIFILLDGKIKYTLNPQTLAISKNVSDIEIYKAMKMGEYKLAQSDEQSVLLDHSLKPIAELQLSKNFKVIGDKLFDASGNRLIEINMNQFSPTTNTND